MGIFCGFVTTTLRSRPVKEEGSDELVKRYPLGRLPCSRQSMREEVLVRYRNALATTAKFRKKTPDQGYAVARVSAPTVSGNIALSTAPSRSRARPPKVTYAELLLCQESEGLYIGAGGPF